MDEHEQDELRRFVSEQQEVLRQWANAPERKREQEELLEWARKQQEELKEWFKADGELPADAGDDLGDGIN